MSDELEPEQHMHMTGAAVGTLFEWAKAVFDERDLGHAWPLTEEPLRLALVQSWIILEEDRGDVGGEQRDELAAALSAEQPNHPLWLEFAGWRLERWQQVLPDFVVDARRRGFVSVPGLIGVDLEAVLIAETRGGEARAIEAGEPVVVQRFVIRHTTVGARVAGIGGVLPVPGWPPSETESLPF